MDTEILGVPFDSLLVAFFGGFILAAAYRAVHLTDGASSKDAAKKGLLRATLIYAVYPFAQTFLRFQHTDSLREMWAVTIVYWVMVAGYVASAMIHNRRIKEDDG